jgi:hypothetical protein
MWGSAAEIRVQWSCDGCSAAAQGRLEVSATDRQFLLLTLWVYLVDVDCVAREICRRGWAIIGYRDGG